MSASESDGENEIFGLAQDNEYLDYLSFDSPELQEFYSFYDVSRRSISSEIVVFPKEKLTELQKIFYPQEINAYQRHSRELQSIQQILRTLPSRADESILESLKARIVEKQKKLAEIVLCLDELKEHLETRFQTDQDFRALLNEWRSAPRELRRIDLNPQELEALSRAPSGPYATFQLPDNESSADVESLSPRLSK